MQATGGLTPHLQLPNDITNFLCLQHGLVQLVARCFRILVRNEGEVDRCACGRVRTKEQAVASRTNEQDGFIDRVEWGN